MLRYYYSKDGQTVEGPTPESELKKMLESGALPGTARVRIMGATEWMPAVEALCEEDTDGEEAVAEAGPIIEFFRPVGRVRLFVAAAAVFVAGCIAAGVVYSQGRPVPEFAPTEYAPLQGALDSSDSKKFVNGVQSNGGKVGMRMVQGSEALSRWTEPGPLAAMILIGTCGIAGFVIGVGLRLPRQ